MDEREFSSKHQSPVLVYGCPGIALFVTGGMILEGSFGDDWLTFLGLLAVGAGLLAIIAAGVGAGLRHAERQ